MRSTLELAKGGTSVLTSISKNRAARLLLFVVSYASLVAIEQALALANGLVPLALSLGTAVGVLVRMDNRDRVVVVAVVFVVSAGAGLISGLAPGVAIGGGLVAAVVSAVGASLVLLLGNRSLPRWDGFAALGAVAAVAALVSAAGWSAITALQGTASVMDAWQVSWVAAFAGIVLAAPALLMFRQSRVPVTTGRLVELTVAVAATVIVLALVLGVGSGATVGESALSYMLVPLVLWFAVRFGLAITAAVASLANLTVLIASHSGLGPYSTYVMSVDSLLMMELALTVAAIAAYAVAVNEEQRRSSDLQLTAAHGLVQSLLANSDAMISIVTYNRNGQARYVLANPRFARMMGHEVDEIIGRRQDDLSANPASAARMRAEDQAVIESNRSQVFVTRSELNNSDPSTRGSRVYLVTKFPVASAEDELAAVGSVAIDITDHRRRERLMRLTFDESPVPMVRLAWHNGRAGHVLDANRSAASLLEVPVSTLIGRSLDRFTHESEKGLTLVAAEGAVGHPRRREARLVRGNGDDAWVTVTATVVEASAGLDGAEIVNEDEAFALVVFEDVSARKVAEQTLTHQALHDALTGVLNRYALIDRLEAALNRLWRANNYIAVLFCDLDGFKNLNDTLGHRAGDQMLISVSERLQEVMRPQDTVARLGGDEFVLVCEDLPSPGQARVIGERIRESMRAPFKVDGRDYGVTVSVGIATTTDPHTLAEDLLRRADLAMYRAKDNGRNRVEYYAEELEARAVAHVEATETLRRALEEKQVIVHYQPIIDTLTGRIEGVEALARIRAADGTLVHPATFIGVAETSGLVTPMGEQVLDQALDQLQEWATAGFDIQMNVNVSPRQLSRASFAPNVFERMMARSLPPSSLCLEITEGAVVDATGPTLITLRRLRSYGVHVGIDDFGTGYSSLTTLKYLPADVLKVDRSFVEGLGSDSNDSAIVGAVIKVAHDLGCVVVAEGVESERQVTALQEMGCDQVQGYRYGRPVPAEDMAILLARGSIKPREIDLTEQRDVKN